ncbi:TIGR02099 family protein [Chitinibacter sp. SCUT-21]|uniref:YhdP family protein n=1 Tax=Chitinibacter sp. SCUT-21 TaxID=2970891 RepID=UPI0035A6D253
MSLAFLRQLKVLTARITHWHLRWLARLALTLLLLLTICGLTWQFYAVPRLNDYKPWLEQQLTQTIGAPIKIASLSGGWRGIRPQLTITRFQLINSQQQAMLQFERMEGTLSWWQLLLGELNFSHLHLQAPQLDVLRLKNGQWQVAGITLATNQSTAEAVPHDGQFLNWLLEQGELSIAQGVLRLSDQRGEFPALSANNVQLNVENWFSRHQAVLQFSPTQLAGAPVEISANLQGEDIKQLSAWSGWVKLNLPQANLSHAAPWLSPLFPQFKVQSGRGALALKLELSAGILDGVDADLQLTDWRLQLPEQAQLNLPLFDGRILWRLSEQQRTLELRAKQIRTADTLLCQQCELQYLQTKAKQSLTARNWSLAGLNAYSAFLPESLAQFRHAKLAGNLTKFNIEWPGDWPLNKAAKTPDLSALTLEVEGRSLAWDQLGQWPSGQGFDIDLMLEPKGGRLKIIGEQAQLVYPAHFLEAMNFARLHSEFDWQQEGKGWQLNLKGFKAISPELELSAQGQYWWPGHGMGQVDLTANIERLNANRVYAYLPRVLGDDVLVWLKTSLLAGQAKKGQLRWRGDVAQFPYTLGTAAAKTGQFTVKTQAENVTIHYGNDWPMITKVDGQVTIDGMQLNVDAQRGDITGTALEAVKVTIPNLEFNQHILVDGKVKGQTAHFLDFVQNSPVRLATQGFLDELTAQGLGELDLKLDIPIEDFEKTKIDGLYRFNANQLNFGASIPPLSQAKGAVRFTEASMKVLPSTANALGGSVQLQGDTDAQGALNLALKGQGDLAQALQYYLPPLSPWLQGKVPFAANLKVDSDKFALNLASDLIGGLVYLPAPLAKSAAQIRPFKLKVSDDKGLTRVDFTYAKDLQAAFLLGDDASSMRGKVLLVQEGTNLAEVITLPVKGLQIGGAWPALNVNDWLPVLPGQSMPSTVERKTAAMSSPTIIIDQLGFEQLSLGGQLLNDVRLSGQMNSQGLQANLLSRQIAGDVQWLSSQNRVSAHLSKLWLPLKNAPTHAASDRGAKILKLPPVVESTTKSALDEWLSWPAIHMVADDFRFKNVELGKLTLKSRPQERSIEFDELSLRNADGQISLAGQWLKQNSWERTQAKVKIDSPNMGKLLLRIGYPEAMKAAPLILHGDGQWQGAPWRPAWDTVSGKLNLNIGAGQFIQLEPGVGRFLSILSLQALPRRLKLDFSDVFSSGFEFDEISGTALIEQGVARTSDLKINGPAAKVRFSGDANFVAGTQNLRVRIVPSIGGAVALGVGVLNPIAGLATLAVQSVMDNPLGELLAYEFQIDGSMSDPQIKKVGVKPESPKIK